MAFGIFRNYSEIKGLPSRGDHLIYHPFGEGQAKNHVNGIPKKFSILLEVAKPH
jgi:hypothetical protein